ncbi:hypothetical protein ACLOJK_028292, partial [Asimina triloba]
YVAFVGKGNVKLIDNFLDPALESKSSGASAFFAGGEEEVGKEEVSSKQCALVDRGGVALLKSREAKLLSKCEAAQSEAVWFQEELEARELRWRTFRHHFRREMFNLWLSWNIFAATFIGAGKSSSALITSRVDT